jgi:dUTP pyrophosphatase
MENVLNYLQERKKMKVKIKTLNERAVIPTYAKNGDAGMDLYVTDIIGENDDSITYSFGISMEIPVGYVGLIFPRSSVRNYDIILSNSVGVIDSGYRGEIQATFVKTMGRKSAVYSSGERAAQIIILPFPSIEFEEVEELSETERGHGGFGSTGLN